MSRRDSQSRPGPRRSLSAASTAGRIESGGDASLARDLEGALRAAWTGRDIAESLTHPLHTYAARVAPATARDLVAVVGQGAPDRRRLLCDPFCGSGTTLVEACAAGWDAIGVDLNPLAALIASAKTLGARRAELKRLVATGRAIAGRAIAEGKAARRAGYEPPPPRHPGKVPAKQRDKALRHWYAAHVRAELEFIAGQIDAVGGFGDPFADALRACLSAILVKASRRTSDTDPSRSERRVGRGAPSRWFRLRVELLVAGLEDMAREGGGSGRAVVGDSRDLSAAGIGPASVHGIVTSPPYPGTYDYAEQHELRAIFLGLPTRRFEEGEIGARRRLSARGAWRANLAAAHRDYGASFAEMGRVLAPRSLAAVVLGDARAGRGAIWADELVAETLPDGLEVVAWAWQERAKLGGVERRAFGDRPKREHIFLLRAAA